MTPSLKLFATKTSVNSNPKSHGSGNCPGGFSGGFDFVPYSAQVPLPPPPYSGPALLLRYLPYRICILYIPCTTACILIVYCVQRLFLFSMKFYMDAITCKTFTNVETWFVFNGCDNAVVDMYPSFSSNVHFVRSAKAL